MDNVILLSKFKNNLGDVISDYKNKISEIELKEEFLQLLSDLVNYSRSDTLLLPFYDESLLSKIFEVVFPIYNTHLNKLKTAKYLIESSKNIDKKHFPQYNNMVKEVEQIHNDIIKYHEELISNNTYSSDRENYNSIINKYSSMYELIGEDKFNGLIEDIDLFHDALYECKLDDEEINGILNIAILSNLNFLNDNGILDVKEAKDNTLKEATQNLSELIDSSL